MNKYTLYTRIGWALAMVVLLGALCYYNLPYLMESSAKENAAAENSASSTSSLTGQTGSDGNVSTSEASSGQEAGSGNPSSTVIDPSIPEGGNPGMRCPDFTVPLYGNGPKTFTLSEHFGKVIVINFWTTFCTPCVKELPYFEAYLQEHPDDVVFIGLHGKIVSEKDMDGWFERHPFKLTFGHDETGEVQASLNGNFVYPQTIILDKHGVITYNETISLTPEKLHELLDPLILKD